MGCTVGVSLIHSRLAALCQMKTSEINRTLGRINNRPTALWLSFGGLLWSFMACRAVSVPLTAFIQHASQICHGHHMLMSAANEYECAVHKPSLSLITFLYTSLSWESSPWIKCKSWLYWAKIHDYHTKMAHRWEQNTLTLQQIEHFEANILVKVWEMSGLIAASLLRLEWRNNREYSVMSLKL